MQPSLTLELLEHASVAQLEVEDLAQSLKLGSISPGPNGPFLLNGIIRIGEQVDKSRDHESGDKALFPVVVEDPARML